MNKDSLFPLSLVHTNDGARAKTQVKFSELFTKIPIITTQIG